MKKILKVLGIILGAVLVLLGGYLIYLFASYHRIPDNQQLEVETARNREDTEENKLTTDTEYSALTYNIGFGAYTPNFSFFMGMSPPRGGINSPTVLGASRSAR